MGSERLWCQVEEEIGHFRICHVRELIDSTQVPLRDTVTEQTYVYPHIALSIADDVTHLQVAMLSPQEHMNHL